MNPSMIISLHHQIVHWNKTESLSIGPLVTVKFESKYSSFMKIYLEMSSAKWGPFRSGHNELITIYNGINEFLSHLNKITSVFIVSKHGNLGMTQQITAKGLWDEIT